jgi:hypothetical protein
MSDEADDVKDDPFLRIVCGEHQYDLYGQQKDDVGSEKINFCAVVCGGLRLNVLDKFVWSPCQKTFQPILFVLDDHHILSALLVGDDDKGKADTF